MLYNKIVHNDFLPTTYYLKISGVSIFERFETGLLYFIKNASQPFIITIFIILFLGIFVNYKDKIDKRIFLLPTIFLAQFFYSIYTGGDYADPDVLTVNRFFSLGFPCAFILIAVLGDQFNLKKLINSYRGSTTLAGKIYKANINLIAFISLLVLTSVINFLPMLRVIYDRRLPMVK